AAECTGLPLPVIRGRWARSAEPRRIRASVADHPSRPARQLLYQAATQHNARAPQDDGRKAKGYFTPSTSKALVWCVAASSEKQQNTTLPIRDFFCNSAETVPTARRAARSGGKW